MNDQLPNLSLGIPAVLTSLNYWLGIFTSLAILYIRYRIRQPAIEIVGGGGGSAPLGASRYNGSNITFRNEPKFLGLVVKREPLGISSVLIRIVGEKHRSFPIDISKMKNEKGYIEVEPGQTTQIPFVAMFEGRIFPNCGADIDVIAKTNSILEKSGTVRVQLDLGDIYGRHYRFPYSISLTEDRASLDGFRMSTQTSYTLKQRFRDMRMAWKEFRYAVFGRWFP